MRALRGDDGGPRPFGSGSADYSCHAQKPYTSLRGSPAVQAHFVGVTLVVNSSGYAGILVADAMGAADSIDVLWIRVCVGPELDDTNVRELSVQSYRLVDWISEEAIVILGFIHGVRGLGPLWAREQRTP